MSNDTKERVKRIIRDAITLNPTISLRELHGVLLKRNIKIGNLNSLSKLRKDITDEALSEIDEKLMFQQIAQAKERNRVITERLWPVALGDSNNQKAPSYSEQIAAAEAIIKLDLSLLRTEIDLGIFKKKPLTEEEILQRRNKPLSPEQRANIHRALKNWGLVS
jgi:hypothetical protein